jgi:hypothetical protein
MNTTLKVVLMGAALTAGLVFAGGTANAAPAASGGEDVPGYRQALAHDGIPWDDDHSLQVGRGVCQLLRQGWTDQQIIDKANADTDVPRWFLTDMTVDARTYLCPGMSGWAV